MKIILAEHRGFCYGVKRAVDTANSYINKGCTYTLGPIIHNPQVVKTLEDQGIKVANDLSEVPTGRVIIRSHGVGPDVYENAKARQLEIVDATCPHVRRAQLSANELLNGGYTVVVIGEKRHPEVKSIVEWTNNQAFVIEKLDDAHELPEQGKIGVVAQTTFSNEPFEAIVRVLKGKCQEIKVNRTICTATDQRQQAALDLAGKVDVMVVVGGKNSANTSRLAQLCQEKGAITYHIETAAELDPEWFITKQTAGVTAGASTPDWVIEEVVKKMQEFDEMMNEKVKQIETGNIVQGKIVGLRKDEVFVDIGYKAEGVITLSELAFPVPEQASDVVSEGQIIDVYVIDADSTEGAIKLSKIKADNIVAWEKLEVAQSSNQAVEVKVTAVVKGGLTVAVFGIRGFIPASQVDLHFVEELSSYIGQTLACRPIEVDKDKQRAVLSRRQILEEEKRQREEEVYATLTEGQIIKGTVRRIADFGAFVDIGGIDGLVHISDLSWHRVKTVTEVVNVGDEVEVYVQKVDPIARRISLSLKQVQRDPWLDAVEDFSEGMTVTGKISKLAKFGAFVEIKPGVEGLVHLSELADRRVANADEVVEQGQTVKAKILSVDKKSKRISLSIAQAQQESERAEYQEFLEQPQSFGTTIGEKFGHLFGRKE